MKNYIIIDFPLKKSFSNGYTLSFELIKKNRVAMFDRGVYFVYGKNGSGKTTLINLMSITDGQIGKSSPNNIKYITDESCLCIREMNQITSASYRNKYFNMLQQNMFIMKGVKVKTYYKIFGNMNAVKQNEKNKLIGQLSGGERQKIFLSIFLNIEKPFWFLDEPFNSIDGNNKIELIKRLKEIALRESDNIAFLTDHFEFSKYLENNPLKFNDSIQIEVQDNLDKLYGNLYIYKINETDFDVIIKEIYRKNCIKSIL